MNSRTTKKAEGGKVREVEGTKLGIVIEMHNNFEEAEEEVKPKMLTPKLRITSKKELYVVEDENTSPFRDK